MDLLLLDEDFEICGLIDDWESLIWNRKYYECGNFKLQVNISYLEQFTNAKYLYCKDKREIGRLETFKFSTSSDKKYLSYSGRFLESVLGDRVIDTTYNFSSKTTEVICRSLVDSIAINPDDEDRIIENLELGDLQGLGEKRTVQITGENLLDEEYELCKEDELSISVDYDFDIQKLIFRVWQGLDRTDEQTDNTWAIFSKNFENITNEEYDKDETQYCNYAYVAGEEDEDTGERTITTVDKVSDGETRKELYVDARDLQKDDDMTDDEYIETLKERGIEKLNENTKVETSDFTIDPLSNLEYKKDFDLGDKVIYKNTELGIIVENRIVEISESYENGVQTIDVTFGDDYNVQKIKEAM